MQLRNEKPDIGLNNSDIYQDVLCNCATFLHCCSFISTRWLKICFCPYRVDTCHVKIKTQISVLNMLKRLDKIRFRGPKRDEFLDPAESPNASDSECNDDVPVKHRSSIKETEEQRDPVSDGFSSVGNIKGESVRKCWIHFVFQNVVVVFVSVEKCRDVIRLWKIVNLYFEDSVTRVEIHSVQIIIYLISKFLPWPESL